LALYLSRVRSSEVLDRTGRPLRAESINYVSTSGEHLIPHLASVPIDLDIGPSQGSCAPLIPGLAEGQFICFRCNRTKNYEVRVDSPIGYYIVRD
jgi:hypothetical protein